MRTPVEKPAPSAETREGAERVIVKWLDSLIAENRCVEVVVKGQVLEAKCGHPLPCPHHPDGSDDLVQVPVVDPSPLLGEQVGVPLGELVVEPTAEAAEPAGHVHDPSMTPADPLGYDGEADG
jgi:hypothetical protein